MSNLDPLPPSTDKEFWENADINTNITPEPVYKPTGHYFVKTRGRSAYCSHCSWGFDLDPGDKVDDGHLYDKDGKLVI